MVNIILINLQWPAYYVKASQLQNPKYLFQNTPIMLISFVNIKSIKFGIRSPEK